MNCSLEPWAVSVGERQVRRRRRGAVALEPRQGTDNAGLSPWTRSWVSFLPIGDRELMALTTNLMQGKFLMSEPS